MKHALYMGVPLSEFWQLTPWQLHICTIAFNKREKRDHNNSVYYMYHGALLTRAGKKFPKMRDFLIQDKKPVKGINEGDIMRRLKAHAAQHKKLKNGSSS